MRMLHVACWRVRGVRGVVLGGGFGCCALHLCVLLWRCKQEWAAYNDQKVLDYQSIGRPSDANRTPIGRQVAAGCNTQHAHCNMQHCNMQHAHCNMQHIADDRRHERTACRADRPAQEGPHSIPPQPQRVNQCIDRTAVLSLLLRCEAASKHRCLLQACAAGRVCASCCCNLWLATARSTGAGADALADAPHARVVPAAGHSPH